MADRVTIYSQNRSSSIRVSVSEARKWKSNATVGNVYDTSLNSIELNIFGDYLLTGNMYCSNDVKQNIASKIGISLPNAYNVSSRSLTPAGSNDSTNSNKSWNYSDDEMN